MLLAIVFHQRHYRPQMAPRQPRKQVMLHLKLKPAMKPIHPRRALDIHRPRRLLLKPIVARRLADINVAGPVVKRELHVLE